MARSVWKGPFVELSLLKKAEDALNILQFSPKAMGVEVRKVLASAIANAENNHNLDVDALVVAEASVGKSITMKRFTPRARGRSSRAGKPASSSFCRTPTTPSAGGTA